MIKKLFFTFIILFTTSLFGQNINGDDISITKVGAYPNPLIQETHVLFFSNKTQNIVFEVKNVLGKSIYKTSIIANQGKNKISFQKKELASGMYIYTLQTKTEMVSKRLVIK